MSEKKGFTIIQNEIINSGKISLKAMGLFLYLKSKPKDWRFSTLRIRNDLQDGLASINSAMKELETLQLLERRKTKNEKGQFVINYIFSDEEKTVIEKPLSENQTWKTEHGKTVVGKSKTTKPVVGNPTNINKKDLTKKDKIIIIEENPISSSEENGGLFPEEKKEKKPIKKEDGKLYSNMVEIYFDWFKGLNEGIPPKFGTADGSCMKQIINYFKYIHKEAKNGKNEAEEIELMFKFIFKNWQKIDPFLQKQTKLTQINGNLQNIINDLKNGKKRNTNSNDKSDDTRKNRIDDAFSKIDDIFNSKR